MGRLTNLCLLSLLSVVLNAEIGIGIAGESPSAELFRQGPLKVEQLEIRTWGQPPDKFLVVGLPTSAGKYPVLMFLHGYVPLRNNFYWDLLHQVASHGFIAVAPLLYDFTGWDATQEMIDAAYIADGLKEGLQLHFPPHLRNVEPDFTKVAIAGHARGGKVAFGVALGLV
uniref:TSA: Wollemia nobilis Ref_Wollemi_Transcript_5878_637 transcribed RNA sequence n=1 Tax=Wollemia nobilis TaxID=56998 RepID=A0A0C9RPA5_9CONI